MSLRSCRSGNVTAATLADSVGKSIGLTMDCRARDPDCVTEDRARAERFAELFRAVHLTFHRRDGPSTAAALRAVSWAKAPGVVDVILLRDGRM